MNPISSQQSLAPFSQGPFAGSRSMQAEQVRAGAVSLERSTDLTITTAEGDTVTLSLATAIEANAGVYRSESMADGRRSATQTAYADYSRRQSMAITVDGELNDEELADIREAVDAIGGMIEDFLAGDLQAMAADGELLKELDSIASLDASFSYAQQVTYGEQETVRLSSETQVQGPGRGHHHHRQGRLRQLMQHIDHLTDTMADRIGEFGHRQKQATASVNHLLGRYGNGGTTASPTDRLNQTVVQTIQSMFVQKMETRSEAGDFAFTYTA